MNSPNDFVLPDLKCKKCNAIIPTNGMMSLDGRVKLKTPRIACELCARAAAPPRPKVIRLRKGERHPDQSEINVPSIHIS